VRALTYFYGHKRILAQFWPRNVVKRGLCYGKVCPSDTLLSRAYVSRYRYMLCTTR